MYQLIEQTKEFVVINKSPGISVHKDQQAQGLAMLLREDLGLEQIFPVHRLDKVTSGIMVFAKDAETASQLSEQFRLQQTQKFYLAVSDRKARRKQGLIAGDMEKSRRGGWKLLPSTRNPAITQFFSCSLKPGFRLFLLKPMTGKTHQIRVALKSEGAAILGDPLYSGSIADRTYLHAYSLSFYLSGKTYCYSCLPEQGELFDKEAMRIIQEHYADPASLHWPVVKH